MAVQKLSNSDWELVIATTDDFLEEAARKDHHGPGDAYQDMVEAWSKPMQCVAVAYLIQRNQPDIASWLAGEIFPFNPLPAWPGSELSVVLPWLPR